MVAVVAIVAGLGLQQAQAVIIFEEDFDETGVGHGVALNDPAFGWTAAEGGLVYTNNPPVIHIGNSAGGSSLSDNAMAKAIPGGPYTLGAGEFFRLSYVARPTSNPVYVFVSEAATTTGANDYMQIAMQTPSGNEPYTHWNDSDHSDGDQSGGLSGTFVTESTAHIRVDFDGSGHSLYSSPVGGSWTHLGDFTGGGMDTALSVQINIVGDAGNIDSIVLEKIPEPATFAMLLAGLVGLAPVAWRRRRSTSP
tara:strand:- start:815 stop:1567 length:753 start_codon:yes stop_codon:yes gene_type:complete